MTSPVDEALVRKACQGDPEAFARLVEQHYRTVYGLAFSVVGNWAAADDIAQETFLQAWSKRETLRNARVFPAWLRRIARNLGVNWIESAIYRRRLAERYRQETDPSAPSAQAPDVHTDALARRADVWQGLQNLSPTLRDAVVQFYLHGKTVRDLADALGISENAAKKRLQKGRAKLRDYFERQWKRELSEARDAFQPQSAKERFLLGVAIGPALPEIGAQSVATGIGLWWASVQGSVLQKALLGGTFMTVKKTAVAAVILVLAVSALYWTQLGGKINVPQGAEGGVDRALKPTEQNKNARHANPVRGAVSLASADPDSGQAPGAGDSETEMIVTPNKIEDPNDYAWVTGTVVNADNEPLPGVEVSVGALGLSLSPKDAEPKLLAANRAAYNRFLYSPEHYWTSYTDAFGEFLVEGLAYEGLAIVSARAPNYLSAMKRVDLSPGQGTTPLRLVLKPGATVYGRLLSATGTPITDAALKLAGFVADDHAQGESIGEISFTDPEGVFEMGVEGAGVASLVAESATYGHATFSKVPVDPAKEVVLRYEAGATVFGVVSDQAGTPVSDVEVRLDGWVVNSTGIAKGATYSAATNADGTFRIEDVATGQTYETRVMGAGNKPIGVGAELRDLEAGGEYELNFVLRAAMTIEGTVLGVESDEPVPGIAVVAAAVEGSMRGAAVTGADGGYAIELVGDGGVFWVFAEYNREGARIAAGPSELPGVHVELKPGETVEQDLEILEPVTRSFWVVDGAGAPVSNARLSAFESGSDGEGAYQRQERTDAEGRVTLHGLEPFNTIAIQFNKEGLLPTSSEALAGQPGKVLPEELIVVHAPAGIAAVMHGPEGEVLVDQKMTLSVRDNNGKTRELTARTDDHGVLYLRGVLPATEVDLYITTEVNHEDALETLWIQTDPVVLEANQETDLGELVLTRLRD
ncbi:MAG: sigma-70 family RNA polymerase sigma factor [Candidatus Hydrogenedentes bacterium]|nr:sigma-70 family RNA polymerase sigma factor [Candidatus Hydrogenedentota bacterium]